MKYKILILLLLLGGLYLIKKDIGDINSPYYALILEETSDRYKYTPSQIDIFVSSKIDDFAKDNNIKLHVYDKDQPVEPNSWWEKAISENRDKQLPRLIISHGRKTYNDVVTSVDDTIKILEKYK